MGILILGSVMMLVAFLAAIAAAAFFAVHFWRLQRAYERDHQQHVNYAYGKTPYDHQQPTQDVRTSQAFNDQVEAAIEQSVAERLPGVILSMQR